MSSIFLTALDAVLPIVLLSVLGYALKKSGFLTKEFTRVGSKLVFRLCLSSSLFINVYNISDISAVPWAVVAFCLVIICVLFCLGFISAILTTQIPARRGVLLHGVFRSNFAIIGLSLASSLGGDEASAVASVVSAFAIPLYNVLGVISLRIFSGGQSKMSAKQFAADILKNPMILGALAGAGCIAIRYVQIAAFDKVAFSLQNDLPFVINTIGKLKTMTTPLALIVLGAQFEFSAVNGLFKEILVGSLWRLVFAPAVGIGAAVLLSSYTDIISFGTSSYPALIALFGSPVAVSTAVIATEMGGDDQLATQLVVWTSLGSVFTIYVTVCIMMAAGLLVI